MYVYESFPGYNPPVLRRKGTNVKQCMLLGRYLSCVVCILKKLQIKKRTPRTCVRNI